MVRFLLGRLVGYLLFGLVSYAAGRLLLQTAGAEQLWVGTAYAVFSVLLIGSSISRARHRCPGRLIQRIVPSLRGWRLLVPAVAGLATGLNFCPPFLLALARGITAAALSATLLFFFTFFLGTSVFFALVPFIGVLRASSGLRVVGRMAGVVVGAYYLYSGILMIAGGVKSL